MTWGSTWLDQVEGSRRFSTHSLRRGADYARYDWQLEVEVEAGRASTTARSGRRMTYEATVQVPVLTAEEWEPIIEQLAGSTQSTAAVLDGELPDDIGLALLPEPATLQLSCSCQSNDTPCKHAAAMLYLLAEAIDEDPFELLHLRGLARRDLVERVTAERRLDLDDGVTPPGEAATASSANDPGHKDGDPGDDGGDLVWSDVVGPLPAERPLPAEHGVLPPFPSEPPATAGFTADGLRTLATDAAHRAFALLQGDGSAYDKIDSTADLARRAAAARGTDRWKHLVDQSGVSSQELTARAQAWEVAGAVGVEAQVAPAELRRMIDRASGETVQWRRTDAGPWVRFEKLRGRWEAVAASGEGPDLTLYDDSV